jgi:hypothetical protein
VSKGRAPNQTDLVRMQRALAMLTAYDIGIEENDFDLFKELTEGETDPVGAIQALSQLSWLMLKSLETQGVDKREVMTWYGQRFARRI